LKAVKDNSATRPSSKYQLDSSTPFPESPQLLDKDLAGYGSVEPKSPKFNFTQLGCRFKWPRAIEGISVHGLSWPRVLKLTLNVSVKPRFVFNLLEDIISLDIYQSIKDISDLR
jgi:hypothetical protein